MKYRPSFFLKFSLLACFLSLGRVEPIDESQSLNQKIQTDQGSVIPEASKSRADDIAEDEETVLRKLKAFRAKKQKKTEPSKEHRSFDELERERRNFEAAERAVREVFREIFPLTAAYFL